MIKNLLGIRGILLFLIIAHHIKYTISNSDFGKSLYNFLDNGAFAVLFFFLLSGFCIALGYKDRFNIINPKNYLEFIKKRLVKLYPLYIITGFVEFVALFYPQNAKSLYAFIFLYIPMLQPWTEYSYIGNGAGWFLAALFFCYILTPFIIKFVNHMNQKKYVYLYIICNYSILILITSILLFFRKEADNYYYKWPLIRLFQYSIGIALGILYKDYFQSIIKKLSALNYAKKSIIDVFFIVLLMLAMYYVPHDIFSQTLICLPVICFFMLYLCLESRGILDDILCCKVTVFFAKISFEGYLIHYIILRIFKPYFMNYIYTPLGICWVFVCLIVTTAIISVMYQKLTNYITQKINL